MMTPCSSKEMSMPGMPEAIFLEDLLVLEAVFNTIAKVIDGRGWQSDRSWRCSLRDWGWQRARPERKVSSDPSSKRHQQVRLDGTKREGADFLHWDKSETLIFWTRWLNSKGNDCHRCWVCFREFSIKSSPKFAHKEILNLTFLVSKPWII
jgi:hypothetical protein